MFQAPAVVRRVLEKTYTGSCTVRAKRETTKENGADGFDEVVLLKNQPCRLSFSSVGAVNPDGTGAVKAQVVKLFIAPECKIPEGSRITVTQNGVEGEYTYSGRPAVYSSHQEILLRDFGGYA